MHGLENRQGEKPEVRSLLLRHFLVQSILCYADGHDRKQRTSNHLAVRSRKEVSTGCDYDQTFNQTPLCPVRGISLANEGFIVETLQREMVTLPRRASRFLCIMKAN